MSKGLKFAIACGLFLAIWYGRHLYFASIDELDEVDSHKVAKTSDVVEGELDKMRAKGGVSFKAKSDKTLKKIENMNFEEQYKEVREIKSDLVAHDKKCEEAAEKLFPNDNLIDVNDSFYNKQDWVIEKLHDTFSKTLIKVEADELYSLLHNMVENEQPIKAKEVFDLVNDKSVCRPMKSMSFIDTVTEAYVKKGWAEPMRQELVYVFMTMSNHILGENYSTKNITEVLGIMGTLAERKLLPEETKEEMAAFFQKLKDQEKAFRSSFRPENDEKTNYTVLSEDMARKKELALELRELIHRYRRQYAPEFE